MKKLLWPHPCQTASQKMPEQRTAQRGQAVLLVAVSLAALIGLAALAIDVTSLYVARSEAEKTADQAALAGAKAFVSSGFTSGGLGDWTDGGVQSTACNGASGLADLQAQAAAQQNTIAGAPATTVTTACDFTNPEDPQITVTVQRTGLPNFFSRIWSPAAGQVTAVSKAEAFNPSGSTTQIAVANVKPWLVANCDPTSPPLSGGNLGCVLAGTIFPAYFLDPANNYAINNNGKFIGKPITLHQAKPIAGLLLTSLVGGYSVLDLPISSSSASCPASSATSCGSVTPDAPGFYETAACSNSAQLTCGSATNQIAGPVRIDFTISPPNSTEPGKCLTHASDYGLGNGQDVLNAPGVPTTLTGGSNNPDPALQGRADVSRSDSVVTVPIWNGDLLCINGVNCADFQIVGFMQLGITDVQSNGNIDAVILNVAGCGSATGTAIAGGGTSPIPVRLVR
ncbi:MAG TPA: pilus assembly protein TadG-related protein [Candidatus Sulfotelmatobacter sp.]|jgi:hypothetical protein